jgi:hypothetical protein
MYFGRATWEACSGNLEFWEPSQHLLLDTGKPRKKPVSRWSVAGPSGYWLLASSLAFKVKHQYMPQTCWAKEHRINLICVVSSWFFALPNFTMHGHIDIKSERLQYIAIWYYWFLKFFVTKSFSNLIRHFPAQLDHLAHAEVDKIVQTV